MTNTTIPPGIVAFKNSQGDIRNLKDCPKSVQEMGYEAIVKYHLISPPVSIIHTIEINGQQFSVGDKLQGIEWGPIAKFTYEEDMLGREGMGQWIGWCANGVSFFMQVQSKLPPSTPVTEVPVKEDRSGLIFEIKEFLYDLIDGDFISSITMRQKAIELCEKYWIVIKPTTMKENEGIKSAEEIFKKHLAPMPSGSQWIIEAMEEYHNQFKSTQQGGEEERDFEMDVLLQWIKHRDLGDDIQDEMTAFVKAHKFEEAASARDRKYANTDILMKLWESVKDIQKKYKFPIS